MDVMRVYAFRDPARALNVIIESHLTTYIAVLHY